MIVTFQNVLVCDVVTYHYDGKDYPRLIIYEHDKLHRIRIPSTIGYDKKIGERVIVSCDLQVINGKEKLSIIEK